jgi:hypothetical protein
MKIQVNCISCKAEYTRIKTIKETWGKHWIDLVFYTDFNEGNDVIKCTDDPSYKGCEEKAVNRLKQIKEKNTYDWYFFVDDDTFVNIPNMLSFIKTLNSKYAYGYSTTGCLGYPFFQGGAGFFISNECFNRILPESIYIRGTGFSDTVTCQILTENNISLMFNNDLLNREETNNFLSDRFKNAITFHTIKTKNKMLEYYNNVYNS